MGFFGFSSFCALLFVGHASAGAVVDVTSDRVLRAATRRADVFRRSMRIGKKFEAEVVYIEEENGWAGGSVFASQLKVASEKPILNLEEIEHHLEDVQCHNGKMTLGFVDSVSAVDARHACHGSEGGLVITSHESCNKEGERAVYTVNGVSFAEDGMALELSVTQSLWEKSFDRIEIGFGHTHDSHLFRRHSDFAKVRRKRAASASVTIPPVSIPTDTPDNVNQVTFDLSWKVENKTFSISDFTAGIPPDLIPLPDLSNVPVEVGCKTCSTQGKLVLSQGAIVIDPKQIDLVPDLLQGGDDGKDIASVITGGFFELTANDMAGHFELFARPRATGSFNIKLFELPVLGYTIPGVGRAGAFFEAELSADYDIQGGFEVNYGMDLVVPNNSSVKIELVDITKSGITGFPNTTLTPLPFSFNQKDITATLSLALVPSVPIGFAFEKSLNASISVGMELPRLDAVIKTLANADTNCNDLGSAPPATNGSAAIGPLVLVEANVSITANVGFEVKFPLLPPPLDGVSTEAQFFSTLFPLTTECLAPLAGFAPATDVYGPGGGATGAVTPTRSATGVHPSATSSCDGRVSCSCANSTVTVYVPPTSSPYTSVATPPFGNGTTPVYTPAPSTTVPAGTGAVTVPTSGVTPGPSGTGTTAPVQFPGAADTLRVPLMGWQVGVLWVSLAFGALVS